jgi:hypothetical protein
MTMVLLVKRQPANGSDILKMEELQWMMMSGLADRQLQVSLITQMIKHLWKLSTDFPRSGRRG